MIYQGDRQRGSRKERVCLCRLRVPICNLAILVMILSPEDDLH